MEFEKAWETLMKVEPKRCTTKTGKVFTFEINNDSIAFYPNEGQGDKKPVTKKRFKDFYHIFFEQHRRSHEDFRNATGQKSKAATFTYCKPIFEMLEIIDSGGVTESPMGQRPVINSKSPSAGRVIRRSEGPQQQNRTRRVGKYSGLLDYLYKIDKNQKQLVLTFDEFEKIGMITLPPSAYEEKSWWKANLGRNLADTEWELHKIYPQAKNLVLRRKEADLHNRIHDYIENIMEGRPILGQLDPYTLKEWLAYCQKVGLFHEGTVLFEKSGLDLDKLGDSLRYDIEEHYHVCKREINRTNNLKLIDNVA